MDRGSEGCGKRFSGEREIAVSMDEGRVRVEGD
jgi:hypothetical protein